MDRNCSLSFPGQETGGVKLRQQEHISRQTKVGAQDLAKTNADPRSLCRLVDWETEMVYGREICGGLQIKRTAETQETFQCEDSWSVKLALHRSVILQPCPALPFSSHSLEDVERYRTQPGLWLEPLHLLKAYQVLQLLSLIDVLK